RLAAPALVGHLVDVAVGAGEVATAARLEHELAFASGLRETFLASAAMGLAGALAVFLLLRGGTPAAAAGIPRARTESAAPADAVAPPARN
ncbi:hypothetical protein AB0B44_43965, partial [Streptomyces sp. NPDC041003]